MKKIAVFVFSLIFGMFVFSGGFAQSKSVETFPSIEPYLSFELSSPNLTPKQIVSIAISFSSYPQMSATDFSKYLSFYNELESRVTSEKFQKYSERVKADEVLMLMYEKTLRRYSARQTRITTMFDEGTYNCVSSSVLYLALAKAAGLDVIGNRAPDHCFCSVIIDGKKFDVETTNPMGFNPGEKRMIEQNGSGTKYATVPKKIYNGRYEISDAMLVSLVARNINSIEMDKKNYETAVPVAASRFVFIQNDDVSQYNDGRKDLDVTFSNYAAELQKKKKFYESMLWMDSVVERWGMSDGLRQNYSDSIYNAVVSLIEKKDFDSATENLDERKEFVVQKDFEELEQNIFIFSTSDAAEKISSFNEKVLYIKKQMSNPLAKNKKVANRLNTILENAWIKRISDVMNADDFMGAAKLCDDALSDLPSSSKLKQMRQNSLNNYAVTVHNAFADFANKGKYDEARKVLDEGLKNYPGSSTLKNDLTRLNRMQK